MKKYIPDYYKDFQCIADQCKDSCCIGWEIMIDQKSYKKYQQTKGKFHDRLMSGIEKGTEPVFHLDPHKRCVFLNDQNLCDIYIQLGESALCDICTQHPRFHNIYGNIQQSGLGLACEEAARLILGSKEWKLELYNETKDGPQDMEEEIFAEQIFETQKAILDILQDRENSIEQRIDTIYDLVKAIQDDLNHSGKISENYQKNKVKQNHILSQMMEEDYLQTWLAIYQELDYMDPAIQNVFLRSKSLIPDFADKKLDDPYIEKLMSYFIYRYFMKACEDDNLVDKVKFAILNCLMIEMMNRYYKENDIDQTSIEVARIYSKEIEYSQENLETIFEELLFD